MNLNAFAGEKRIHKFTVQKMTLLRPNKNNNTDLDTFIKNDKLKYFQMIKWQCL